MQSRLYFLSMFKNLYETSIQRIILKHLESSEFRHSILQRYGSFSLKYYSHVSKNVYFESGSNSSECFVGIFIEEIVKRLTNTYFGLKYYLILSIIEIEEVEYLVPSNLKSPFKNISLCHLNINRDGGT